MDEPKAKQKKKHVPQRGKAKRLSRTEVFLRRQRELWYCDLYLSCTHSFCTVETKTWLETHIWHAKRMHMENMWGYRLVSHLRFTGLPYSRFTPHRLLHPQKSRFDLRIVPRCMAQ